MNIKIITFTFLLFLLSASAFCQCYETFDRKCDIKSIIDLKSHKDSLTDSIILRFIMSVGLDCVNNAEFSEASNSTLFWLADIKTKEFIKLLNDNKDQLEIDFIYKEFESPVSDGIDISAIYNKIKALNDESEVSLRLLKSLDKAIIK